ncbi:YusW family protein [Virgibacillus sp. 179-BFC.A HS]|uniref:YusW family protein n=1 Tax=Tigheibacillus jepli TaxID=3035914 RepID=A0ABU5CDD4_9BACI|nr:YusW family protein [Virgibacillus sp. 179-BFC.A HS]MDY0404346.1 YusW family protein [Virgibacillus sp. 179-BFC.A HS]
MKNFIAICSALLLAIFLTACSQNDQTDNKTNNDSTQESSNAGGDINNNNGQKPADDNQSDNNKSTENNSGASTSTDVAKNQDDMKKMMQDLDFKEIELEISYGKNKEYEAEIEHHDNGDIEAEVEDEIHNEDISDDVKAFNSIYPKAKKLQIDKNTEKQDAIDQVLNAFDLQSDYEKFEVEFTFDDGTKLTFED